MLPLKDQVRKAIWDAINPKTGKKRIDEAFPLAIRAATRDTDMFIRFRNGSTWQCLGSDNYQGAIGSSPIGIVYSEWALANPSARAYLRPILLENGGWQAYITTARGKNHAYKSYMAALRDPQALAILQTAHETGVFTPEQLEAERAEYRALYGEDAGNALFEQEYMCSFDAAILGAIWGAEIAKLTREGRYTRVPHDPEYPVFTAWDIGKTDATAIFFFQVIANEVRVIDFEQSTLKDPDYFAGRLLAQEITINIINNEIVIEKGDDIPELAHRKAYDYKTHWLPHDARAKTFAAKKSVQQQLDRALGNIRITPNLSWYDGMQAGRKLWDRAVVDYQCEDGLEACKQYRYDWDDDKKKFRDKPVHDWTSHPSDAWRYMAIAYKTDPSPEKLTPNQAKDSYGFDESDDTWAII